MRLTNWKADGGVDWELFRKPVFEALRRFDRVNRGHPLFGAMMMLKSLVLQALYHLSDGETEFQISDRPFFMRCLSLGFADKVPDAKTSRLTVISLF